MQGKPNDGRAGGSRKKLTLSLAQLHCHRMDGGQERKGSVKNIFQFFPPRCQSIWDIFLCWRFFYPLFGQKVQVKVILNQDGLLRMLLSLCAEFGYKFHYYENGFYTEISIVTEFLFFVCIPLAAPLPSDSPFLSLGFKIILKSAKKRVWRRFCRNTTRGYFKYKCICEKLYSVCRWSKQDQKGCRSWGKIDRGSYNTSSLITVHLFFSIYRILLVEGAKLDL